VPFIVDSLTDQRVVELMDYIRSPKTSAYHQKFVTYNKNFICYILLVGNPHEIYRLKN